MRTMWKNCGLVAISLVMVIVLMACGRMLERQDASQAATDVSTAWSKAYNAADPMALAALYANDARSIPSIGSAVVGREAIESYWSSDIGKGGAATKLTTTDATIRGDTLHVEGTYEVTGVDNVGLVNGQYQQTWTRENDRWLVLREMWRLDPALFRSVENAEQLTSDWMAAYNAGNAKALVGFYANDAVLSIVPSGTFSGRVAIESFWIRDLGAARPVTTLTLTDAYVSGELAHLEGEYKVSEKGVQTDGRFVQLWMREGNTWRIHREMWLQ